MGEGGGCLVREEAGESCQEVALTSAGAGARDQEQGGRQEQAPEDRALEAWIQEERPQVTLSFLMDR